MKRLTQAVLATLPVIQSLMGCTVSTDLPPDDILPTVEINTPANNATVGGGVAIDVTANDNFSVEVVRIRIDGTLRATFYERPYHYVWGTIGLPQNSVHTIVAEAVDPSRNTGQALISVTVLNVPN